MCIRDRLDTIGKCTGPTNYREWGRNVRHAFGLYALDMLKVVDGTPCPEETDVDGVDARDKANNNIYSILYFHTNCSANMTVRADESTEVGCLGDGVAAWKALTERFDGNTKKARRACREKLFNITMPFGGYPTDFISTMDDLRLRLADMGEQLLDDTYAGLLLNSVSYTHLTLPTILLV